MCDGSKMSRREFVGCASVAGVISAVMVSGATAAPADQAPRKGGILRIGSAGGSTTDGLDPRTWTDVPSPARSYKQRRAGGLDE
jgi:peptide/nickel transport system substrate-binding protein